MSRIVRERVERFASALSAGMPERPIDRLARRPGVTVIVPIFNSAHALRRCLRTLGEEAAEILLIDDHSSEREVAEVCAAFARENTRARVLVNDRNLGFVSTVNRGMLEASRGNDVVLLNSDTELTPGWLRALSIAAHLDERTATVCPLSNAAGVFSTPRAHEDGDLPEGLDPVQCQRLLSWVSEREHEEVPTTSGFCMLIKRTVIERIGRFDSGLFLRGYGEENDFNARASDAGFHHRVCDSRFVYHARGLSFGADKHALKRKNQRILASLHPRHAEDQRAWEKSSRLDRVRDAHAAMIDSAEREIFCGEVEITFAKNTKGMLSAEARRIACRPVGDALEVDLFGLSTVRVDQDCARVFFELFFRFEPARFVAAEPLPERALLVASLFGVLGG